MTSRHRRPSQESVADAPSLLMPSSAWLECRVRESHSRSVLACFVQTTLDLVDYVMRNLQAGLIEQGKAMQLALAFYR